MGGSSYSSKDWDSFSKSRSYSDPKTTTEKIYSCRDLHSDLDPKKFIIRECVDGKENPLSTPIILGLDVTGSMSPVLDKIARSGLNTLCSEIFNRKPVTDPHICTLAIGDMYCDEAPLQATQFEADIRIFEQLEKIYLENGGGGNNHESYILAWWFAKYKTLTDSFKKRGQKGFIFTIGDEEITPKISELEIKKHLGISQARTFYAQELYDITSLEWNIFHVIIKEGNYASRNLSSVVKSWQDVIGSQHLLITEDYKNLAEIIVSTIQTAQGVSKDEIINSWKSKDVIKNVSKALENISSTNLTKYNSHKSMDDLL